MFYFKVIYFLNNRYNKKKIYYSYFNSIILSDYGLYLNTKDNHEKPCS